MSAAAQPLNDPAALSALADGEALGAEADDLLRTWSGDAQLRQQWHAYHLIGDALRSDDLCAEPGHDEAFLQRLRLRLADEPPIVAPTAVPATRIGVLRRFSRWSAPVAMAAGVAAVAGVTVMMQRGPASPGPVVAGAGAPARVVVPVAAGGAVERDPRLMRYINEHRLSGAGAIVEGPVGGVRIVDYRPEGR